MKLVGKSSKRNQNTKSSQSENVLRASSNESDALDLFLASRKTIKELIAPNGVNPNPLDYLVIDDNGEQLYTMCFYIHKLPTAATFATTFASLFNFPNTTSNVFIDPMVAGKSAKQLDKRVLMLDSERIAAEKDGNRNKLRKIMGKLSDAEAWARDIESGNNLLFEVAFLFTLQATDLEKLRLMASDFHMRAREKGIELSACYGVHPEAFVSGYPTNRIFSSKYGPIKSTTIKRHVLDKGALSTIFNHTRSDFSHKFGIIAGRNMFTGQPVTFDVYDPSHNGYGLIICGKTGTGKSATVKMYLSRYIDFEYRVRSIDFEARGTMGEYAMMAEKVGGINFQIKANSTNIMNLYEIAEEDEFDEISGTEYPVLNLTAKISDLKNIHMIMIKNGREIEDFSEATFIERIVIDTIAELYEKIGIRNGDVDSLYETSSSIINNRLTAGKVRKKLPTITDFFKLILINQKKNSQSTLGNATFYSKPYQIIVDAMKDYVKELYYCPECLHFYTNDEYNSLSEDENGNKICKCQSKTQIEIIQGVRAYYDGQSTVKASSDTPHINIDISQLPETDKMIALLISLNFMQENYIKKNSVNPKKTKKLVVLIDELHKTFPYEEARRFVSDVYRTARKRNVSPWVATQALADFRGYTETEGIIKNTTSLLLLKQDFQDREFIKKSTPLTDSQVEQVLNLGGDPNDNEEKDARRGEVCLIDNGRVVFVKVDYLIDSEALIVETDVNKISKMYKGTNVQDIAI